MGVLKDFTITDLGVLVTSIGSVITAILIALQSSRCKKIKCCGCECDRTPPTEAKQKQKKDEEVITLDDVDINNHP
jgi:hypothetical protein